MLGTGGHVAIVNTDKQSRANSWGLTTAETETKTAGCSWHLLACVNPTVHVQPCGPPHMRSGYCL